MEDSSKKTRTTKGIKKAVSTPKDLETENPTSPQANPVIESAGAAVTLPFPTLDSQSSQNANLPSEGVSASSADQPVATEDSRSQYEKLVNPKNYHEYMRGSRFRGR